MEKIFWETIEDSDDPADFEDFLAKFPESLLAGIAGRPLKRPTAPQPATAVAALTPPAPRRSAERRVGTERRSPWAPAPSQNN